MIILNHVTHKYSELVTIIAVIAETDYSDQEELQTVNHGSCQSEQKIQRRRSGLVSAKHS